MFEFEVKDDLIVTKKSIVAVFEIEPIDIFLLNKDDQASFFGNIYRIFHVLKGQMQINVLIRRSNVEDLTNHFNSLLKQNAVNPTRLEIVQNQIDDLTEILEDPDEQILNKRFFFELKENCKVGDERSVHEAGRKLADNINRIGSAFSLSQLGIKQLVKEDLRRYIDQYYK